MRSTKQQWKNNFNLLVKHKECVGHCNVPYKQMEDSKILERGLLNSVQLTVKTDLIKYKNRDLTILELFGALEVNKKTICLISSFVISIHIEPKKYIKTYIRNLYWLCCLYPFVL